MKKIIIIGLLMLSACSAWAEDKIYTVADGTKLKCTGKMINGSIDDYKEVVDYYTIQDGRIRSKNLINLYGNINKEPRKVLRQKITDDKISFKDRYYEVWTANYKWVKINRHTGEYTFNAKRDFGMWFRVANVVGSCEIVED